MSAPTVEYFFSFRSPYSYLSAPRVFDLPRRYGVELVWRGVRPMAMRGQPLPRAKQLYILRDAAREADRLGLPFGRIYDPLGEGVWRCLCVAELAKAEDRLADFVTIAARAIWGEGVDVSRDAPLRALCERAGLDWEECRRAIETPEYRERVESNTAALAALGHWGVPTLVFEEQAYWGQDRIEDLERALRGRDGRMKRAWVVFALGLALAACDGDGGHDDQSTSGSNGSAASTTAAVTCSGADPTHKNAYFGDMHVHTLFSLDAYFFNGLNGTREAYRIAKGEPGSLPAGEDDPYTAGRTIQLDRPLDFAAVSDHSDFLGDWRLLCQANGILPIGTNPLCNAVGEYLRKNITSIVNGGAPPAFYVLTTAAAPTPLTLIPWQEQLAVADEENEPCSFTTFPGFEWTSQFHDQMIHRNVYFGGAKRPIDVPHVAKLTDVTAETSDNTNDDWRLYDWLDANCDPSAGCQTLSIPHNPNQSAGGMYLPRDPASGLPAGRDGKPLTLADATLRAKYDRSIEIFQHKGNSECGVGLGIYEDRVDPSCGLELAKNVCRGLPQDPPECGQFCTGDAATDPDFCRLQTTPTFATGVCEFAGRNGTSGPDRKCVAPLDMARNILADGLAVDDVLGVNPMRMGFIGSSDTHNGDPGNVAESNFPGHGGVLDGDPRTQLGYWTCDKAGEDPSDPAHCTNRKFLDRARGFNPGGLAGAWAPENTRASIWSALERGESFATSGPRMRIRTLASWTPPPDDVCDRLTAGDNPVDTGEMQGAVMGGDLPAGGSGAPYLVVWAEQDAGGAAPGLPLQKLDVVKGWSDAQGPHVKVYDGVAKTTAPVDPPSSETCVAATNGHPERLCAVWHDPDFEPGKRAYWYARAFEVPSCRWSTELCVANHVDCGALDPANGMFPADLPMRDFEGCCSIQGKPGSFHGENAFNTITERAWASPIWYQP